MVNKLASFFLLTAGASLLLLSSCQIDPDPPDRYALVYGVSDYEDSVQIKIEEKIFHFPNLNWTDEDAKSVADLFHQKGYKTLLRLNDGNTDYEKFDIKEASVEQFKKDINFLRQNSDENSIIIIYFSGHGTSGFPSVEDKEPYNSNKQNEWLVTYHNADETITKDAYDSFNDYFISDDFMAEKIRELPTTKNVLIIDACLSGGFIGSSYDVDTAPSDYSTKDEQIDGIFGEAFRSYFSSDSADVTWQEGVVMTASGEDENSLEPLSGDTYYQHGFFTYILLQATSNDLNDDGFISTMELYSYARKYFEVIFNSYWSHKDQYLPRISGGAVDFVLFEAD